MKETAPPHTPRSLRHFLSLTQPVFFTLSAWLYRRSGAQPGHNQQRYRFYHRRYAVRHSRPRAYHHGADFTHTQRHTDCLLHNASRSAALLSICLGGTAQIRLDVQRRLHDASRRGLAASVQGPGLGAVALVVLSGAGWFMLWLLDSPLHQPFANSMSRLPG